MMTSLNAPSSGFPVAPADVLGLFAWSEGIWYMVASKRYSCIGLDFTVENCLHEFAYIASLTPLQGFPIRIEIQVLAAHAP